MTAETPEGLFTHDFVERDDVRLHCAATGTTASDGGRTIVMLHGFPGFWRCWWRIAARLRHRHRCVAPDLRGFNLSSKPAGVERYAIAEIVADIVAVIEALGVGKVVLAAHDWGGVIAWILTTLRPDLIDRLVIVNAAHPLLLERDLRGDPRQREASRYMLRYCDADAVHVLQRGNYAVLVHAVLRQGLRRGYFTAEDKQA